MKGKFRHYHAGNIVAAAHLAMGHTPTAIRKAALKKQEESPPADYEYYQAMIDRATLESNKKNGAYREG